MWNDDKRFGVAETYTSPPLGAVKFTMPSVVFFYKMGADTHDADWDSISPRTLRRFLDAIEGSRYLYGDFLTDGRSLHDPRR